MGSTSSSVTFAPTRGCVAAPSLPGMAGSIIEQLKIIDPLTNPTANGASAADAFDLVIPSMPGYGFSGKPTETGWDTVRMARAYTELMRRLGYARFAATGDWGAHIVDQFGVESPPELVGIHTNFPGAVRPDVATAVQSGGPAPSGLDDEQTRLYEKLKYFFATDVSYALEMGTHPQALYGIADSPVGLAAWMLDHDATSLALMAVSGWKVGAFPTTSSTTSPTTGHQHRGSLRDVFWKTSSASSIRRASHPGSRERLSGRAL